MSSKLFNAPSESSSMSCTYPPTTKPLKQSTHDKSKPITLNSLKRSPSDRSSSPSPRLGHRCRHCGSLHSRKEVVAKMVKKKLKDGGSNDTRADWKDPEELRAFCQFCAAQVLNGNRKGGFLTKTGVDALIKKLGANGKVVTYPQVKRKWDYLRKEWKQYKCFENETGLGIDPTTKMLSATDEWWTRKIAACPNAKTFKDKLLPNLNLLNIMFEGTVATGKNAFCPSGQIPKETTEGSGDSVPKETTEGSGDSADATEFVDPQCEPFVNVDAMEVEGVSSSRAGLAVNKGKGLATNAYFFKPICKNPKKKRSIAEDMSETLKSISNVLVERSNASTRTIASTATGHVKTIMDTVFSLPGVHKGHHLHKFCTNFFVENDLAMGMFVSLDYDKNVQLNWLEQQYKRHPEFHF